MNLATSLALITVLGLVANYLFTKIKLPGLIGMLLLGVLIGPYCLKWLSLESVNTLAPFKDIALIVILLRAGLGINRDNLKKVGKTAIKMSIIPCIMEGFTVAGLAMTLLDFSFVQGGILGFVIAAVSPAVIVPQMLSLIDNGIGKIKGIPTLVLAAASIDDIIAITLFSTFLGLYGGEHMQVEMKIIGIPVSILLGILIGIIIGSLMIFIFRRWHIRDTKKVLLLMGVGVFLTALEDLLKDKVEIAALLGVMTIGFLILEKVPLVAKRLSVKFSKIWVFAEILLFVLVGAQVNIQVALDAGLIGGIILLGGLIARSIGVLISNIGTSYTVKEKGFIVIAYLPKATVQAAIGAKALEMGVVSGDIILAIAVLSIMVTAPLGAIGISMTGKRWL